MSTHYRPQTKLRKGNVFTSACQEFCPQEGGVCQTRQAPPWADTLLLGRLGRHPPGHTPPGQTRQTPLGQTPPLADTPRQTPPWQTPPTQETATAVDGAHSTGMHFCRWKLVFKSCSLTINFFRKGMVKFEGNQTCNKITRHGPGRVFPSKSIFEFKIHSLTTVCIYDAGTKSLFQRPLIPDTSHSDIKFNTQWRKEFLFNRGFRSFDKSDRSDIFVNVADICLCVNVLL